VDKLVSVTFDEAIDPSTLSAISFTLEDAVANPVSGTVVAAGTDGTFTPDSALSYGTTYTATVTTEVTDLAGNPLAADYVWSFDTHVRSWGAVELVGNNDGMYAQVAVDAAGNAIAVWYQFDGVRTNISANRYAVGAGWGTAELIESDDAGDAHYPQVAVDAAGNAVAVWQQHDGAHNRIWANRYEVGTGWGTAQLIENNDASSSESPQVAMDAAGNAVAVWRQSGIWTNRYVVGTGWGTAELIETDDANGSDNPQIAVNAAGNAFAVWDQFESQRHNIWASQYVVGAGWGTAELIETDDTGHAQRPQIAIDAAGNAVAVWDQNDGTRRNIMANRHMVGIGWGAVLHVETDNAGDAAAPQIAMDAAGNAVVVWPQSDGTRANIWANRYGVGAGWGTAELIESDDAGDAHYPQVAVDAAGNAVAVWRQYDGTHDSIWANRYVAGTSWGTAELLETDDAGDAQRPQVALTSIGNAIAVWDQTDGTHYNICASRYE